MEEIRGTLGADSLAYVSNQGLMRAIGMSQDDLCLGCLTGVYPVQIPGEKMRPQRRLDLFLERPEAEAEEAPPEARRP